jgi:hypothetical protein
LHRFATASSPLISAQGRLKRISECKSASSEKQTLTSSDMKNSTATQPWKAWNVPNSTTSTTTTKRVVATTDDGQNGQAPNLPGAVVHRK